MKNVKNRTKGLLQLALGFSITIALSFSYQFVISYFALEVSGNLKKLLLIVFMAPLFIAGAFFYDKIKKCK